MCRQVKLHRKTVVFFSISLGMLPQIPCFDHGFMTVVEIVMMIGVNVNILITIMVQ